MNTPKLRRAVAGFTLIELAVAITVAAVVAGGAVALFAGLLGLDRQGRGDLATAIARDRLAEQFRADVAAAADCKPIDEKNPAVGIVLSGPSGQTVRYVAGEGQVERLVAAGETSAPRELYRLGDETRTSFQIATGSPVLVSATIDAIVSGPRPIQPLPSGAEVRRRLSIVAVLGREQRLAEAVEHAAGPEKIEPSPDSSPDSPASSETTTP